MEKPMVFRSVRSLTANVVGALTFMTVHESARRRALDAPPMGLGAARDGEVTANQATIVARYVAGTLAGALVTDTMQYGRLPE
jgi:hypothetical protein